MKTRTNAARMRSERKKLVISHILVTGVLFLATVTCASFLTSAKTTYVVSDGTDTVTLTTFTDDTATVIQEAGFQLNKGDLYTAAPDTDTTAVDIQRSFQVFVTHGTEVNVITTVGGTVSDILNDLDIVLGPQDHCNYPLDAVLEPNMVLDILSYTTEFVTEEVAIPHETFYVANPQMERGATNVLEKGSDGIQKITTKRDSLNGKLYQERVILDTEFTPATPEYIEVGIYGCSASQIPENCTHIRTLDGRILPFRSVKSMTATAYSSEQANLTDTTASGAKTRVGIVATDWSVIPCGATVYIVSPYGSWTYGTAWVADTGVVGNRIDLYRNTIAECFQFGVRDALVFIL